ncbi:DUF294 nucleotidyltransferase-like domain-containing protein [Litchfieldia alkalitelluris]|uniref:DUF294 nucleotidyltransferase-like domain-containing protein n=1 Tax=Litchfieldia alkalitelluris TaxID=304268 RepID=UPI0009969312|nr:DUF294 nucleotidyltransferase-like domain-containing protein [Litchfieldia alkalitelluris]
MNDELSLLKQWRDEHIKAYTNNHESLNQFHDGLMTKTIQLVIKKVASEQGTPPAHFAFFLMGSAGRSEQSVWSDQDHGIIFEGHGKGHQDYFLRLGKEISDALAKVGYEYCDGKVMASNVLWCKSLSEWKEQISSWLIEESWESLRHFSTFFDSRVLIGEHQLLSSLKELAFVRLNSNPRLYLRLLENVSHIKKGVGLFGQLIPIDTGEETGSINLKEKVFFSYVNSLRLLALKEKISEPSTLSRFMLLADDYKNIKDYQNDFVSLLQYRLYFQQNSTSYEGVHYLKLESLTKKEKQEIKRIMKRGYKLFSETRAIIEKGD